MLTDVLEINQKEYMDVVRLAVKTGSNVLVLGPSGGGKTKMAEQVAKEEDANLIYINLAVLERPDFQGLPTLSEDKRFVTYATPNFLPFKDVELSEKKESFKKVINALNERKDNLSEDQKDEKAQIETLLAEVREELDKVNSVEFSSTLQNAKKYLKSKRFDTYLSQQMVDVDFNDKPVVILFDEVDKASTDTTQTLLEFLQFHSINGRKLNVKCCVLTGNLPDEHAHTSNISHAITKRCKTYKLKLDFQLWRDWAFENGLNEQVVGFLLTEQGWLNKSAPDGDPTAYAIPSPRTWEYAGTELDKLRDVDDYSKSDISHLQRLIVAGYVGQTAATKFMNWVKFFKDVDPHVSELMRNGTHPPKTLGASQILVCAILACQRAYAELDKNSKSTKKEDKEKVFKIHKHVYSWIDTLETDKQMAGVRLGIGPNAMKCIEYGLSGVEEFKTVFKRIKTALGEHGAEITSKRR